MARTEKILTPLWCICSSTVEAPQILPMFPAYYIFNSLLVLLLVLHIAWTYLILLIVKSSLKSGQVSKHFPCSSA